MINKLVKLIRNEDDFLIAAHVSPDGDAIGSMLGLGWVLEQLGKQYELAVVNLNDVPAKYRFLPGYGRLKVAKSLNKKVFIALDTANESRLGPLASALKTCRFTVNIDHHPDNSNFAAFNWIGTSVSSTAEMVYSLSREFGVETTLEAATCIYVGMLTDTGRWQYSNTTSRSLVIASELLDAGVKPIDIFKQIYESNSVAWLRLLSIGLGKAVVDQKLGLAYTFVEREDLKQAGAGLAETESLVDWLRSIDQVVLAMVLKETKKGELKVSLRSREPINVGALARQFGGGGHNNASGFTTNETPQNIVEKAKVWLTGYF